MYEGNIKSILEDKLCDFQRCTVDYIYQRMEEEGQKRILVADEVGLGKTWIAKGVIAKAYQKYEKQGMAKAKPFKVFYICSNLQLASQNLAKLNFGGRECVVAEINRITQLAEDNGNNRNSSFQIFSLTPETSFSEKSRKGTKRERYIIFHLLNYSLSAKKQRLSFLLRDNVKNWNPCYEQININSEIRNKYEEVLKNLTVSSKMFPNSFAYIETEEEMSLWILIIRVCSKSDNTSKPTQIEYNVFSEIIGELKKQLTHVCLKYMQADYFIMDEFQRYSNLIDLKEDDEDEQHTIAHEIFSESDAKVLMLSATPFKAYTNETDEVTGEAHYEEFKKVLKFLYVNNPVDWKEFETKRSALFTAMLQLQRKEGEEKSILMKTICDLKSYVEDIYSKVIVRTEKIIASNNPNGMTPEREPDYLDATSADINNFKTLDKVFQEIYEKDNEKAPVPIDYAKSAPFALSFLRDYQVGKKAREKGNEIAEITNENKEAFITLEGYKSISNYSFLNPVKDGKMEWPNAKLQMLLKGLAKESLLLWCPPSFPYYKLEGPFKGMESFSKTLIFSAWKLVPKMVSTLVSYESECYTIGQKYTDAKYFAEEVDSNEEIDDEEDSKSSAKRRRRKPYPKLTFKKSEGNMTTLLLAYPSVALANLYDPMDNIWYGKRTLSQIQRVYRRQHIEGFSRRRNKNGRSGISSSQAYWMYPIMLDIERIKDLGKKMSTKWVTAIKQGQPKNKKSHLEYLDSLLREKEYMALPNSLNTKREEVRFADTISNLVLGSPAICAFRSLRRYYKEEKKDDKIINTEEQLQEAAMRIGFAFIDMFNKPESIAVVESAIEGFDGKTGEENRRVEYWNKVLRYCAKGNIQSLLDEYVFLMKSDYESAIEISFAIEKVLKIRTATLRVDDENSFCNDEENEDVHPRNMRTHYAMPFGIQARVDEKNVQRSSDVRNAFNSPFRPFVLTTTSIGQEGLDFHYYCRKIMHWNLPNNPIDFEQREGRINRYRGHVIRLRLVEKFRDQLKVCGDVWSSLFEMAKSEKHNAKLVCDIVPNWLINSDNDDTVGIERIVPLYKYSRDIQKYNHMKKVLGNYKLTFGQPRQEELVEALSCCLDEAEKDELLINLSPIKRRK